MKFTLAVCAILAVAATGYAMKCYQCVDCSTANSADLKECSTSSTQCVKASINDIVSRTCGGTGAPVQCNSATLLSITTITCTCDGDGCNGASGVKGATFLASVIAAALAKMLM